MEDTKIIELFFARSEEGLAEVERKYGALCGRIAYGILSNREDAEECVSSSYIKLWNAIPPKRPESLCGYLCRIVRNTALNAYDTVRRRSAHEQAEELSELFADKETVEQRYDSGRISALINEFLGSCKRKNRIVFTARYFYNMSVNDIADNTGMSVSAVKSSLLRSRKALKSFLEEKGVEV